MNQLLFIELCNILQGVHVLLTMSDFRFISSLKWCMRVITPYKSMKTITTVTVSH